jgi:hypothetical protein
LCSPLRSPPLFKAKSQLLRPMCGRVRPLLTCHEQRKTIGRVEGTRLDLAARRPRLRRVRPRMKTSSLEQRLSPHRPCRERRRRKA